MAAAIDRLEPERIGEINLLLEALGPGEVDLAAVKQRVREMAGRLDKAPLPETYVKLCLEFALVEIADTMVRLTPLGQRVKEQIDPAYLSKLSENQALILEPEVIGHPRIEAKVQEAVKRMGRWIDGTRRFSVGQGLNSSEDFGLKILQSLHLAKFQQDMEGAFLTMDQETFSRITQSSNDLGTKTEEELWRDLEIQRERAKLAECLVVEYEKQRLMVAGEHQLSRCVERVSERDTSAGYDVLSFGIDGDEQFIEVKSSTSTRVRFFWSRLERQVAEDKGNAYWIYFVPRSHELTNVLAGLLMINDPVPKIGSELMEVASNFEVTISDSSKLVDSDKVGPTLAKVLR